MVVVLSSEVLPELRLTVDEYLQADLPEGSRYELVDGVVEMSPNPDGLHEQIVSRLGGMLYQHQLLHPGSIALISFNADVPIPGTQRVREPDLAVYQEWKVKGRRYDIWKTYTPVLVVEVVSFGQERRDYEHKRDDYWLTGILEYWIIDPDADKVTVLTRGARKWRERTYRRGDRIESKALTGLSVDVGKLLAE